MVLNMGPLDWESSALTTRGVNVEMLGVATFFISLQFNLIYSVCEKNKVSFNTRYSLVF